MRNQHPVQWRANSHWKVVAVLWTTVWPCVLRAAVPQTIWRKYWPDILEDALHRYYILHCTVINTLEFRHGPRLCFTIKKIRYLGKPLYSFFYGVGTDSPIHKGILSYRWRYTWRRGFYFIENRKRCGYCYNTLQQEFSSIKIFMYSFVKISNSSRYIMQTSPD